MLTPEVGADLPLGFVSYILDAETMVPMLKLKEAPVADPGKEDLGVYGVAGRLHELLNN